jgi:hypothetical protein
MVMDDVLAEMFPKIREFMRSRIQGLKYPPRILSLQLGDVQDANVRNFFSKFRFCQLWLAEMSVAENQARIASNLEAHTLDLIEKMYTRTEFGEFLLAENLFIFALATDGGVWVVSMDDGHIDLIDGTNSVDGRLDVVHSWEGFEELIESIERTDLREY